MDPMMRAVAAGGAADTRRRAGTFALVGALLAGGIAPAAFAQTQPDTRPIRMIVAVGAGGATDFLARRVAERVSVSLGRPIVVENMASGNGVIAAQTVARAAPDGTTILIGTNTTHASNKVFLKNLPYDPITDFEPVALLGRTTLVLCVTNELPVRSVAELVAHAKANPGKLTFGSGTGSARMAGEMFRAMGGVDIVSVPYRSNAQALTDVLGGRVSMIFGDMSLMQPHIKSNAVRALAVASPQRSPLTPALPTIAEAGVAGYQLVGFIAAFAPAKTPATIVERLGAELVKALNETETANALLANGIEPAPTTPAELGVFVVQEAKRWRDIAVAARIEPE